MTATMAQPTDIMALADRVLARNKQCNRNATHSKMECNFHSDLPGVKLRDNNELGIGRILQLFCQADCPWLETLTLPGEGETAGCINPFAWPGTWRRLDRMTACPAKRRQASHPLPEWCDVRCEHYSRTDFTNGQFIQKCWHRGLERKLGLLQKMNGCPARG